MAAAAVLKLQRAGFSEAQVEALDEFAASRVDVSGLATKADLGQLDSKVAQLDARVTQLDARVVQLDAKVVQLDARVANCATRVELAETKAEIIKWVVGMGFAQIGMILAVLKFFPGGAS